MKTVPVEIPEGKKAEWVNGVLTLVDDWDVMDRIKTFEDAEKWCNENGKRNLVNEYLVANVDGNTAPDLLAYLKLRIITCALNEGWVPDYSKYERRYYMYFHEGACTVVTDNECGTYCYQRPVSLLFKSAKLAEYAFERFRYLYEELRTPYSNKQ